MSIPELKKHFGFLENTGAKVIVIFRSLPAEPSCALVVYTDALPDSWRDELLNITNGQSGQSTVNLYETLQHRQFPDGTSMLSGLHAHGFLKKVTVKQVIMTPLTGQNVPLELINTAIDGNKKVNDVVVPAAPDVVEIDPMTLAKGLLTEASVLEETALQKRKEAYELAPELKPTSGRPPLSNDKAVTDALKKQKRLERDRKNAAQAKVDKKEGVIADKITKKLKRDKQATHPNLSSIDATE